MKLVLVKECKKIERRLEEKQSTVNHLKILTLK